MTMIGKKWTAALTALRRDLHAHPEVAGNETGTQERISTFLQEHGYNNAKPIGKTGLLCPFHFGEGAALLVRVDIDALPIEEVNDFEYRSTYPGVSHKCGHDGHAAIGCGVVLSLMANPLKKGTVYVLFQPAEETGEGSAAVISDPQFRTLKIDFAVALHNIPGVPKHQVLWKKETFTPAVQSLVIHLKGKTSHAAEPHKGLNPAYTVAAIIQKAAAMEETDQQAPGYGLITPVHAVIGTKDYGISAGQAELHFTIRSWTQQRMEEITAAFKAVSEDISRQHRMEFQADFTAAFAANQNDPSVVDHVVHAAQSLGLSCVHKKEPFPWGEDFGLFTQNVPGAMFGLGAGEDTPALHNPDYDYPDEITATGVNMFYLVAKNVCEGNQGAGL